MNMCVNSNGPVSMTCTVGADVTGMIQKHLHLILPLPVLYIFGISGGTISTCSSPLYGVTVSLPECFEGLGDIFQ